MIIFCDDSLNPFIPYLLVGKKLNIHSDMINGEEETVRQVDEASGIGDVNENHATQKS